MSMKDIRPFWNLVLLGLMGVATSVQAMSVELPVFEKTVRGLSGDYGIISYDGRYYDLLLGGVSVPIYDSAMSLPRLLIFLHVAALVAAIGYLIRMIWIERHPIRHNADNRTSSPDRSSRWKGKILKAGSWLVLALICLALLDILADKTFNWVRYIRADKAIHVQVNDAGQFSIARRSFSPEFLSWLLQVGADRGGTNYPVFFHAEGTNSTSILVPIVDRCREMGYKKIILVFEETTKADGY